MSTYRVGWIEEHQVTVEADNAQRAEAVALATTPVPELPTFWNRGMFTSENMSDGLTVPEASFVNAG